MSAFTVVANAVIGAFTDNPVLTKDAGLLLRRKRAVGVFFFVAAALVGAVVLVYGEVAQDDARRWGSLAPAGGPIFVVVLGVLLGASTLFLPALASLAIAGERERGTLPLLIVSGLSPDRIVVGKVFSLLVAAAPFLALGLPVLGATVLFLGVDVAHVVVAVIGVAAYAFSLAAVGVWASAVVSHPRQATALALLAAGAPAFLCALPLFGWAVIFAEQQGDALPIALTGIAAAVVIGAGAMNGAWTLLAPRSAPRWPRARTLFLVAVVLVPVLASAALSVHQAWGGPPYDDDLGAITLVLCAGLGLGATAVFVGNAGSDSTGPTPRAAGMFALAGLVAGAVGFAAVSGDVFPSTHLSNDDVLQLAYVAALVVAGTGLCALGARRLPGRVAPLVAVAAFFVACFAVPAVADEFTYGHEPGSFLNPAYAFDRDADTWLGLLWWGVVGVLCFAGAGGHRRRSA